MAEAFDIDGVKGALGDLSRGGGGVHRGLRVSCMVEAEKMTDLVGESIAKVDDRPRGALIVGEVIVGGVELDVGGEDFSAGRAKGDGGEGDGAVAGMRPLFVAPDENIIEIFNGDAAAIGADGGIGSIAGVEHGEVGTFLVVPGIERLDHGIAKLVGEFKGFGMDVLGALVVDVVVDLLTFPVDREGFFAGLTARRPGGVAGGGLDELGLGGGREAGEEEKNQTGKGEK